MSKRAVSKPGKLLFVASALLVMFAGRIASGQASQSQSAARSVSSPIAEAFDAADVHASAFKKFPRMDGGVLVGDRYLLYDATMTQIIAEAYHLEPDDVQGGPNWLDWDHFDIVAKAPPTTSPATLRQMLKLLLAERFKLDVHRGIAPIQAYVLTAPMGKAKLKESDGTGDSDCKYQPPPAAAAVGAFPQIPITCQNETMEKFAEDLRAWGGDQYLPRAVVDSTGLKGAYSFDLKWTPRGALARAGGDGVSLFDAVDKQLGLKLTLGTAPQPVMIVDSVNESPTPNVPDLDKRMPPLPPPQFEVATIRPSKPEERAEGRFGGDQVNVKAVTLRDLINYAWDLDTLDPNAIAEAPAWLGTDRFDILAKLANDNAGGAPADAQDLPDEEMRQMLRAFIEDRFEMKDHWENRPGTAYRLIAANPKLTPADPKSRTRCGDGPGPDGKDPRLAHPILNRLITCQNITMAQLSLQLPAFAGGYVHSTVVDDTGLKGSYSFTLNFSAAGQLLPGASAAPSDGAQGAADPNGAISLLDALKNQLGLRLEKEKRPVRVLVIDHIEERPTAN